MTQWNLQDWKAWVSWIGEKAKEYICIRFPRELNYMIHLSRLRAKIIDRGMIGELKWIPFIIQRSTLWYESKETKDNSFHLFAEHI